MPGAFIHCVCQLKTRGVSLSILYSYAVVQRLSYSKYGIFYIFCESFLSNTLGYSAIYTEVTIYIMKHYSV